MSTYSTIRNMGLASVLVAALAGFISTGLSADQRVVFERDVPEAASIVVLPEIVVTASRLPT